LSGRLLLFGAGYCGAAIARAATAAGYAITAVSREPRRLALGSSISLTDFNEAATALAEVTHFLATAPPVLTGDPVLERYARAIAAAPSLQWIGYLSATSIYGDRAGTAVDEDSPPAPTNDRGRRRLAAERAWKDAARGRSLDFFRLSAIYGPGRSVFGDIRAGRAQRIQKPGHVFGRIHRDDVVAAVLAAMEHPPRGTSVLNLADDEPAESAAVLEEAARLLDLPAPPAIRFAEAYARMSPMARSLWDESRRVLSRKTQAALCIGWRYPSYREGLAAILAEESSKR
jgi:nucleoside-diphosphate-sugar epimerase